MKISIRRIVRAARKLGCIFGKHSTTDDDEFDSILDTTVATSTTEHEEEQFAVEVVAVMTKDEEPAAAVDHDVPLAYAADESFRNEIALFESNLMAMEVPEDSFEDDADEEELQNIKSETEDDMLELTISQMWFRVEEGMVLEEILDAIDDPSTLEHHVDEFLPVVSTEEDDFETKIAKFESHLMSLEVPEDSFQDDFDKNEFHHAQSEINNDFVYLANLEEQVCLAIEMELREMSSSI